MIRGGTSAKGAWNAYIRFLKSKSPLVEPLLTLLNVTWTIQVPLEMIVQRLMGMNAKIGFVLLLETLKYSPIFLNCVFRTAAKYTLYWISEYRMILRHYIPSMITIEETISELDNSETPLDSILNEIRECGDSPNAVRKFVQSHKTDLYQLCPELAIKGDKKQLERFRELAHIGRPLVYTIIWALSNRGGSRNLKLLTAGWTISLAMDIFANWPELQEHALGLTNFSKEKESKLEREEQSARLMKLLLYMLREPAMSLGVNMYLESVLQSLEGWRLLKPAVGKNESVEPLYFL